MGLLDNLLEAYRSLGTGTSESRDDLLRKARADYELNRAGSVMGSQSRGQAEELRQQGPLMNSLMQMLDFGGFNPYNAPGVGQAAGPVARTGKVFKQAPDTLEGLIRLLARNEEALPTRAALRPAIQNPANPAEIFAGEVGGIHPTDMVTNILNKRGITSPSTMNFGYQLPGENQPFIPETMYNYLKNPEGPKTISGLLDKNIDLDTIFNVLKAGKME